LSYRPQDSNSGAAPDIHAQIERDLQQLSKRALCAHLFGNEWVDHVPAAARNTAYAYYWASGSQQQGSQ
jgi:hypothetical protein